MKLLSICFILTLACLLGCDNKPSGQSIKAPDGQTLNNVKSLTYEIEEENGGKFSAHEGAASGTGPGIKSDSGESITDFNASGPRVLTPDGWGAESGDANIQQSLTMADPKDALQSRMFWLGVGLIFAGAALWRYGRIQTAKYCLIGGVAFIACAFFPGLIVLILIAAVAVNFWPQIMAEIQKIRAQKDAGEKTEALRAVVGGIEELPEPERKAAKAKIAGQAEPRDTEVIRSVKKSDNLPSERP